MSFNLEVFSTGKSAKLHGEKKSTDTYHVKVQASKEVVLCLYILGHVKLFTVFTITASHIRQ